MINNLFDIISIDKYRSKKRPKYSKHIEKLIRNWAIEAHRIDSTKPIGYYHKIFMDRLDKKHIAKKNKTDFFQDQVIEV